MAYTTNAISNTTDAITRMRKVTYNSRSILRKRISDTAAPALAHTYNNRAPSFGQQLQVMTHAYIEKADSRIRFDALVNKLFLPQSCRNRRN